MLQQRVSEAVGARYRVQRELPRGGMARVFLATDPALGREVVIKVLPAEMASAVASERFRREATLLARLQHPHIVPVIEAGNGAGLAWFVMPFIAGDTLADRLAQQHPLPPDAVREIGLELLDALEHAHRAGVVHRDLKPSNVLLHAGHALLADFGVARWAADSDERLTADGHVVGTPAYMAPERRSAAEGTPQSDLWELAGTLFEAWTGVRWEGGRSRDDPSWRKVPAQVRPVLSRALADDPAARWSSAAAFRDALHRGRAPRAARRIALPLGVTMVAGALAWGLLRRGGEAPGVAGMPDSVDLLLLPREPGDTVQRRWTEEAALSLSWLPMVTVSSNPAEPRPARLRVTIGRPRADSVALVGFDARGGLVLDARLGAPDHDAPELSPRRIAQLVLERFFPERRHDLRLLAGATSDVLALHAWYRGAAGFQAGDWSTAEREFTGALRRDPGFLPASWLLMLTRMWQREPHDVELATLAARRDELPPEIAALILAQQEPDLPRRLARYDSIAALVPEFAPARMLAANELFHRGALFGHEALDGVRALRAAAAEVPDLDHRTTWEHVLWGAIKVGDRVAAEAARDRLGGLPGTRERRAFTALAFDERFVPSRAGFRRLILRIGAKGSQVDTLARYLRLAGSFDLPGLQEWMAGLVLRRAGDREQEAAALGAQAVASLMQGRVDEAMRRLEQAASRAAVPTPYQLQWAEWSLLLPAFGFVVPDSQRARAVARLRTELADPGSWPRAGIALIAAREDSGGAVLDSLRRGASHDAVARHLLPVAEAFHDAHRGNIRSALERAGAMLVDPGDAIALQRGPLTRAITLHARGAWLLALGDSSSAERQWRFHENADFQGWPSGPPQEGEVEAALSVPLRWQRAVLLCALGDRARGRALLASAGRHWPPEAIARSHAEMQGLAVATCR